MTFFHVLGRHTDSKNLIFSSRENLVKAVRLIENLLDAPILRASSYVLVNRIEFCYRIFNSGGGRNPPHAKQSREEDTHKMFLCW